MQALELLSRDDAAKALKISTKTLDRLTKTGAIRGVNVGRRKLFRLADLDSYLTSRRDGTPGFSAKVRGEVAADFLAFYTAKEQLSRDAETHQKKMAAVGVDVEFDGLSPHGLLHTSATIAKQTKSKILDEFIAWTFAVPAGKWQDAATSEGRLRSSGVSVAFTGVGQQ